MHDRITIYTDGSCRPNPGPGGWAAILRCGDAIKVISGRSKESTNNRMELTAVLKALKAVKSAKYPIHIFCDSEYVINGATIWSPKWIEKGWRNVKNSGLWIELLAVARDYAITWHWIPREENAKADAFAREARERSL